jgi:hypothetical protein
MMAAIGVVIEEITVEEEEASEAVEEEVDIITIITDKTNKGQGPPIQVHKIKEETGVETNLFSNFHISI